MQNHTMVEFGDTKNAALMIRSVNHSERQEIIAYLDDVGRANVTDIYIKMRTHQSTASSHLAILRRAGVVGYKKNGKEIMYHLNYSVLDYITEIIKEMGDRTVYG